MLSPELDFLGVRPLEAEDAPELYALIEANREHLARWMPWAAGQDLEGTERFVAEAEEQFARDDGFQELIGGRYLDSVVYGLLEEEGGNTPT